MFKDQDKKDTSEYLQGIIDNFNKNFMEWMTKTGCRANLSWQYGKSNRAIKKLQVDGIDLEVYRKPAPEYMAMQAEMAQGVPLDRKMEKPV